MDIRVRRYYFFSSHFQIIFIYYSIKTIDSLKKAIFNHLEQFIDQSILIAKENFTENLVLNLNVFHRICRFQTMYSDSLHQAYLYFISSKQQISHEELINQFDNLNHIKRVKYAKEQCLLIFGTKLPIDKPIQGHQRILLI